MAVKDDQISDNEENNLSRDSQDEQNSMWINRTIKFEQLPTKNRVESKLDNKNK